MKIRKICFVGYGSHVEKTLLPSLNLEKKKRGACMINMVIFFIKIVNWVI